MKIIFLILVTAQASFFIYNKYDKQLTKIIHEKKLSDMEANNNRIQLEMNLLRFSSDRLKAQSTKREFYINSLHEKLLSNDAEVKKLLKKEKWTVDTMKRLFFAVRLSHEKETIRNKVKGVNSFLKRNQTGEAIQVSVGLNRCTLYHYIGRKNYKTKTFKGYDKCKKYLSKFIIGKENQEIRKSRSMI